MERKASAAAASRGDGLNPGDHQLFIVLTRALHLFVSHQAHADWKASGRSSGVTPAVPWVADEAAHGALPFATLGVLWDAALAAKGSPGGLPGLLREFVAAMRLHV